MKISEIPHKIWTSRPITAIKNGAKKIILPGFEGLNLYEVLVFFWQGIQKGAVVTRASAVSFTIFLAMLPTCLLLLSVIPYIPIDNFQSELLLRFEAVMPAPVFDLIGEAFEDLVNRKHSTILSIGFLLTVYYASNSINAILTSFNSSYHLTIRRHPIKQRLIALMLIVILSVLIISGVSLMIFSDTFFEWLFQNHYVEGTFLHIVLLVAKWTAIVLLFMFSISLLYNFGNTERTGWKIVSAGATLATALSILVSSGFAYYVINFGNYNKLYGSLGTLIVLLLWIYFNSLILIIGFELNASIANAKRQKLLM